MNTALQNTISVYFKGERTEMIAFLAFASLLVIAAVFLWMSKDTFARPLAVVLALTSAVAFSVAVPLLLRDGPHRDKLLATSRADLRSVLEKETARMEIVLRNYPIYRYGYLAMILAVVVLVAFFRSPTTLGISVGLLVFAATGLVVDHYSEERAMVYHAQLLQAAQVDGPSSFRPSSP